MNVFVGKPGQSAQHLTGRLVRMKTSPCPDFIDYWERGTLWCLGVRVWKDECQAIKCESKEPGTSMVLIEDPHPLPFENLDGRAPVPMIVFAIATHMLMNPASDLLELLSRKKTLEQAEGDAEPCYSDSVPQCV
jgi:hypothetical protein